MSERAWDDDLRERYDKRRAFAAHTALYIGFVVLCIIFVLNPAYWRQMMTLPNTGDLVLILALWSVVYISRLAAFVVYENYHRARDRYEKPKRLLLEDDGEVADRLAAEPEPPLESRAR